MGLLGAFLGGGGGSWGTLGHPWGGSLWGFGGGFWGHSFFLGGGGLFGSLLDFLLGGPKEGFL